MTERTDPPKATHDSVCDLQARMLTCAAGLENAIDSGAYGSAAMIDGKSLLIEAAAVLEQLKPPPFLGEVMAIIESSDVTRVAPEQQVPHLPVMSDDFTDPGVPAERQHPVSKNACPQCDSRANKTVYRVKNWLELECPVCLHRWKYGNKDNAKWI